MQISETFVGFVSESRRNRISGALWARGRLVGWRWVDGGIGRGMVRLGVAGLGGGGETGGGGLVRPSTETAGKCVRSKQIDET